MAVDAASFSTVTRSMSCGLMKFSGLRPADSPPPGCSGTPSTTNSGSLLAEALVPPRMRMLVPPPGSPLSTTCTPATFPWIRCPGSTTRPVLNCSCPTACTEPVTSRTRRSP